MTEKSSLTPEEAKFCEAIYAKDRALREFMNSNRLTDPVDPGHWLTYLTEIKHTLGNINNDVSFVATLLIKEFLHQRFRITDFDAGGKPQGAPGIDVSTITPDGKVVVGELKTTKPYKPGFGAQQRKTILKDLDRLATTTADHRFMFVIDTDAFQTLCGKTFATRAPGVEVVNLVTGQTFVCSTDRINIVMRHRGG